MVALAGDAGRRGAGGDLAGAVRKARARLVPFLILMYTMAFLDRSNVGFAKQAFQADTGVSDAAFALGAGLFFVGYALLEIPSNLLMHRIGARLWLARIMVTWGVVAAAMVFAVGDLSFYGLRILLGMAEAGFFPGVILFVTYWFPRAERGRILGMFYFGYPLSLMFGSPASGLQDAPWLDAGERDAVARELAAEAEAKRDHGPATLGAALSDRRVLHFVAIYFLIQIGSYGVAFYLPTQVSALLGVAVGPLVGLVSAVPWAVALLAMAVWPHLAVATGRQRGYGALAVLAIGVGLVIAASAPPGIALAALCLTTAGITSAQPIFWTYPTDYLTGVAAAGGIAAINSVGNLGGFLAPNLRVWAEGAFGAPAASLYALAASAALGAALVMALPRRRAAPG